MTGYDFISSANGVLLRTKSRSAETARQVGYRSGVDRFVPSRFFTDMRRSDNSEGLRCLGDTRGENVAFGRNTLKADTHDRQHHALSQSVEWSLSATRQAMANRATEAP